MKILKEKTLSNLIHIFVPQLKNDKLISFLLVKLNYEYFFLMFMC